MAGSRGEGILRTQTDRVGWRTTNMLGLSALAYNCSWQHAVSKPVSEVSQIKHRFTVSCPF